MIDSVAFISRCFTILFVGPFLSRPEDPNTKSAAVSTRLPSYACLIVVLIDAAIYGTVLYLSIQGAGKLVSMKLTDEEQFLQPISSALETITRTENDLYEIIEELSKETTVKQALRENLRSKLTTLRFLHNDSLSIVTKNISQRLHLLKSRTASVLPPASSSNTILMDRARYYVFTCSALLFIEQLVLWAFQYLSLTSSSTYLSCSFIIALIILSQSLGLVYFLQLTDIFPFPSLLCIYTGVLFIRSFASIHHYCFHT